MIRKFLVGTVLLLLGGAGTYVLVVTSRPETEVEAPAPDLALQCVEHGVAESRCPWCDPSLVESMGMCGGHQVPEAFCWLCTPALVTGFKAENDWCGEHDLPESQCRLCNPDVLTQEPLEVDHSGILVDSAPDLALQCAEHGVAESRCPWCDPSLVASMGMCVGHQVPEAFCWLCTPALVTGFKAENDWCGEHDLPESQCRLCNPDLLPQKPQEVDHNGILVEAIPAEELPRFQRAPAVICATNLLRIQFANAEVAHQAGLDHAGVQRRQISHTVTANAEVVFDGNRHGHLSSRAAGVVRDIRVDLGDRVTTGQILAVVDSADLGTAKADFLQARAMVNLWQKNHARELRLSERGIGTQSDLLEAETHLVEHRVALSRSTQRLRNLGLGEAEIAGLSTDSTSGLLPLTAPFAGTVVERSVALGESVAEGFALFAIADTTRMWAILDIYASDMMKIAVGQAVVLDMEGLRGARHGGVITWVSSHLDRQTRTLKARAEILNPEHLLRDGMFGQAVVTVHDREAALAVPKGAVQWEGCCNIVFLRRSDVLYEPRKVSLGYEGKDFFAIENGLAAGDVVVTTGSFLLKTEILRGNIGAGCCELNPGTQ